MPHTAHQPAQQPSPDARTEPLPLAVTAAVTQYEAATLRYDELAAKPVPLTAADLEAFLNAQGAFFDAVAILANHGRLDLTTPAETASRYRQAAAHCRRSATHGDYDACADTQDEMAMCRCQLAAASWPPPDASTSSGRRYE